MAIINENIRDIVVKDPWRNHFHIQPPTGLLNDPNGLIYHDGKYHVFYQWHPNEAVHGLKYWYHITSSDLVTWESDYRIVEPDSLYDNHGAYSGSAFIIDDKIELFYTGNHRDENHNRIPYQVRAELLTDKIGDKLPLINGPQDGYTDHYRDPKILFKNNKFYMILGAQRSNLTGAAVVYTSIDAHKWDFEYELKTSFDKEAYMWECPDIAEVNDKDVLIFCPQGSFNTPEMLTNIYPVVYSVGRFNDLDGEFISDDDFSLLDYGFDFYATQTFLDENKDTTLIAWIGLPEMEYPTDENNWAHVLSVPRQLKVINGHLHQLPHPKLSALRNTLTDDYNNHETYELKIADITSSLTLDIYRSETERFRLHYNHESEQLTLDRSNLTHQFGTNRGTTRVLNVKLTDLWILRDTSTVEIFINNGLYTMTSRFFPEVIKGNIEIESTDSLKIELYTLKETNNDL